MNEPAEPEAEPLVRKTGRPRSAQSHQAILSAALELFAAEGFQGVSIEAIAERAGVGKTTIYRHWDNKADLIKDAINMVRIDTDIQDTGNIRNDLIHMVKITLEVKKRTVMLEMLVAKLIAEIKTNPELYQFFYENLMAARMDRLTRMIQSAQERGELRSDLNVSLIITLIGGPLLYHMLFADLFTPHRTLTNDPEVIVDAILHGIGAQPHEQPRSDTTLT